MIPYVTETKEKKKVEMSRRKEISTYECVQSLSLKVLPTYTILNY